MPDQSERDPNNSLPAVSSPSSPNSKPDSSDSPTSGMQSDSPQRLVLMGTGPFAVPSFEALRQAGHEIALVVTRPQPRVKSRKGPPPSPVRSWAAQHGFGLFDPPSINDDDAIMRVNALKPSLLVVCDYGQILSTAALEAAKFGGINLHGSLLPKYRGAAPVQWAMLSGDSISGVSVILMTPRLDGGPIIATRQTAIGENETAGELEDRLALLGIAATLEAVELVDQWDGDSAIGQRQDPAQVTKAPRLKKSDAAIDWQRPSREIDCHVRGMQPWPVAFTFFQPDEEKPSIRLAIREIQIMNEDSSPHSPGEIVSGEGLRVATRDKIVEVRRLQPAGKREMTGTEFLRGHHPKAGNRLGPG